MAFKEITKQQFFRPMIYILLFIWHKNLCLSLDVGPTPAYDLPAISVYTTNQYLRDLKPGLPKVTIFCN